MKIIEAKSYEDLSNYAAELVLEQISQKPSSVLGLATGSTPKGTYKRLIDDYNQNGTSYQQVNTVNLDEYIGLGPSNQNSYHYFMYQNLFQYIDIPKGNTHIPNGLAPDLQEECRRYEHVVQELGGVDLQILGIGSNGHIGFNEPGTSFQSQTHIVKLAESTRKANARFFNSIDEVPTQAITMGIQTIIQSKKILLLAAGKGKAKAIEQLLAGQTDEQFPASILNQHPNVTVIADQDALSYCQDEIRVKTYV